MSQSNTDTVIDVESEQEPEMELVAREENSPIAQRAENSGSMVSAGSQADQFLTTIQGAASDPSVDMDKMERLYEMYKDIRAHEAKQAYNTAMVECQKEMPAVERKHQNKQTDSWYAKQDDIIRELKPIWTKHGFSLSFYPGENPPDGFVMCKVDVSHIGGDVRTFSYPSPIDDKGIAGKTNKTLTHGMASAFTYGERYLTGLVFSLEFMMKGQDDDGNAAGEKKIERISEDQAANIRALIEEIATYKKIDVKNYEGRFLGYLMAKSIESIPASEYDRAVAILESKRKK